MTETPVSFGMIHPMAPLVNLDAGGGDKGASGEYASHPKPASGGSTSHIGARPKSPGAADAAQNVHVEPADAMNCLAWNCQGIGGASVVRDLVALVGTHSPKLVFFI